MATAGRSRLWRGVWLLVTLALLAVGTTCLAIGIRQAPAVSAPPQVVNRGTPPSVNSATVHGPRLARAVPFRLTIPRIHVSSTLARLGLSPNGTVQVPADPAQAGWYQPGPSPGQSGSAVILGHVDSIHGPAVFYLLSLLKQGDAVSVQLVDGSIAHFTVTAVATYLNADFPSRRVYGPHGFSGLQLVTCGDGFNEQTQEYLGNVVVYSKLRSITPAPRDTAPWGAARPSESSAVA